MSSFARLFLIGSLTFLAPISAISEEGGFPVRLLQIADSGFDRYSSTTDPDEQKWIRDSFERMIVWSSYFDDKLTWYPNGAEYEDLFAIYVEETDLIAAHPDWVLRDANGRMLYIDYECANGTCTQYAADFGNQEFRNYWVDNLHARTKLGYPALFLDDVNMVFRISDGNKPVIPIDPRTNQPMTLHAWRKYMIGMLVDIRKAGRDIHIIHNAIWYADHEGDRDQIRQQILLADEITLEQGFNDPNLTGGDGPYSLDAVLRYIDWIHELGRTVSIEGVPDDNHAREYALALYYISRVDGDMLTDQFITPTSGMWPGYELDPGQPLGGRYRFEGLYRRDFVGGVALVNPPEGTNVTIDLPGYVDLYGNTGPFTLRAQSGAMLLKMN